jgi:hypothetical protein
MVDSKCPIECTPELLENHECDKKKYFLKKILFFVSYKGKNC